MTNEYISRDAVLADIEQTIENSGCVNHESEIIDCVRYATAADVVEVVRCKDCDRRIHSADLTSTVLCPWFGEHRMDKMSFCSNGISSKIRAKWDEISYPDEDNGVPCTMDFFVCSNCGKKVFFNFEKTEKCHKCHAIMDGGEHHAD